MTINVENLKELTKNSCNKGLYSKVLRYKVNIQKSINFLYASKEQVEYEI